MGREGCAHCGTCWGDLTGGEDDNFDLACDGSTGILLDAIVYKILSSFDSFVVTAWN